MNTSRFTHITVMPLLLASLAGCAAPDGTGHRHTGASHDGASGSQERMDMQQMCDMHRQAMAGKTTAEREAMMQERMKAMSPEMRRQMQEMMGSCR